NFAATLRSLRQTNGAMRRMNSEYVVSVAIIRIQILAPWHYSGYGPMVNPESTESGGDEPHGTKVGGGGLHQHVNCGADIPACPQRPDHSAFLKGPITLAAFSKASTEFAPA